MSFKKKPTPFNSAPANRLASQSQATQQQQSPIRSQSQSNSQSPQQQHQSQPIYPWSSHTPLSGQSPSPLRREAHTLSTTAAAAGELFLFGGFVPSSYSASNDLYVISTRDFSTTLLQTSGDVPNSRCGHGAVLTSTTILIWGGWVTFSDQNGRKQDVDDSLYLLNLVSREWTRVVVNGPTPCCRAYHTMTLVGSKLFVFGGQIVTRALNDIWAFDLSRLKSNPVWESYEPTPGNEKPCSRTRHVSVTTGDRIIIFGGIVGEHYFNDTWSFNISARNWTELQCTGSIPSPRADHAAVLVDDIMYVFGGLAPDGTKLGDLTALNLSTLRWSAFQDIGPSPCGRVDHAMASDGRRVFVVGGELSPGVQVDEAKLIHVLDTKLLLNSALLERAEANATEAEKRARLELRELQAKLDESMLSRDEQLRKLEQVQSALKLEKKKKSELEAVRLQLTDQLAQKSALLEQAEANAAEAKKHAGLELRELQAKFDELMLSRDEHLRTLEQAQSALQKATSCAADANERGQCACEQIGEYETKLAEVRAELEEKKSELEAVRLQLTDAKDGGTKSNAKAEKLYAQNTAGPVNTDEDRVTRGILERMRAMEAEIASLRWGEKNFETMECSNEG